MARVASLSDNRQVDESPEDAAKRQDEEWEQLRREAQAVDPYKYRRRGRIMAAVGVGTLGAAVVWGVLHLTDKARNPCERVRDHVCREVPGSPACATYEGIYRESVDDPSAKMRGNVREQCETKIRRLKDEDGVTVR